MVAEVIHGAPSRFDDPARFSFALGGKDRHPFPVPLRTFDQSIDVLRKSLDKARLDGGEKVQGFRRLHRFVEAVETRMTVEADLQAVVKHEMEISPSLGGRSVFDDNPKSTKNRQMTLF